MGKLIWGALVATALIVGEASYAHWRVVGGLGGSESYVNLYADNEIWVRAWVSLVLVLVGVLVIWGLGVCWRWNVLRDTRNNPPIWAELGGKTYRVFRWEGLDSSQTQQVATARITSMHLIRGCALFFLGLAAGAASLFVIVGQFDPIYIELGIDDSRVVNRRVSLFPKSVDQRVTELDELEWIEYDRKVRSLAFVNRDGSRLDTPDVIDIAPEEASMIAARLEKPLEQVR